MNIRQPYNLRCYTTLSEVVRENVSNNTVEACHKDLSLKHR